MVSLENYNAMQKENLLNAANFLPTKTWEQYLYWQTRAFKA